MSTCIETSETKGRTGHRIRRAALLLPALLLAVFLPFAGAGAVVEPGDPIDNLTPTGDAASGGQFGVQISDDGNLVAFESDATNLTSDPDNGNKDVFLTDRAAGTTINITPTGNAFSSAPRISADGSTVVFRSYATNLTSAVDMLNDADIFSYDVASGVTTRITPDNVAGNSGSQLDVSGDGSTIVFSSSANLAGTATGFSKAFIWQAGTFTQMTEGILANNYFTTISADGTTAFFTVFSGSQQLYSWDVAASTATYITPGGFTSASNDGTMLAFADGGQVTIMDRTTPSAPIYTTVPGQAYDWMISGDGNHLIMTKPGAGFVPIMDHFDIANGVATRLIPSIVNFTDVGINHDGSVIGFVNDKPNVTSDPDNGVSDIYVMFENTITCEGATVTVDLNYGQSPTQGDDVIMGTEGNDTIYGLGGDDIICGHKGDDLIVGGAGDDVLYGGRGADTVYGSIGADIIYGGELADDLRGGADDDEIYAQAGGGIIYGGSGDDSIYGGPDNDIIQTGTGNDTAWGYGGDDTLRGLGGDDQLYGGSGDDLLVGGLDVDTLFGGAGDDTLQGHTGNDLLFGEAGNDLLQGGQQDDEMRGGADDDVLQGSGGVDTMFGDTGNDDLLGGSGADILSGGSGGDFCHGQLGSDSEDGTCETTQSVP